MYRVLVVDDEPAAVTNLCYIIEKVCPDYEVVGTAENGRDALEKMRLSCPDLIVTDVRMPIMDGIELVETVIRDMPEAVSYTHLDVYKRQSLCIWSGRRMALSCMYRN